MTNSVTFSAKVEKVSGEGGWHIVRLPLETLSSMREMSGKKGNVPVLVGIGKTSYPTTTMSMGKQQWFFAIKAQVRRDENISDGDMVEVTVAPDFSRIVSNNDAKS